MAFETTQQPSIISPAYSPMFYLNTSERSTESGFVYVYQVYTKDGLSVTKKVFPFPNLYGRFDVSPVVKGYLSSNLMFDVTGCTSTPNTIMQYDTYIGHTGSTHTLTPASTGIKYAFSGADENFDYSKYIFNATGTTEIATKRFLTNVSEGNSYNKYIPRQYQHVPADEYHTWTQIPDANSEIIEIPMYASDFYTLSFLNGVFSGDTVSSAGWIMIRTVHKDGSLGSAHLINPYYNYTPTPDTLENVDKQVITFGCGVQNLIRTYGWGYATGETKETLMDTMFKQENCGDIAYYDVYVTNTNSLTSAKRSPVYRFMMQSQYNENGTTYDQRFNVPKNGVKQIAYLNRLGVYSYFTFAGKSYKSTKQSPSTFTKNRYSLKDGVYGTNNSVRGNTVYANDVSYEYTFNSDWISESTMNSLEEMFTSPEVYLIQPNGMTTITSSGVTQQIETHEAIPLIVLDTSFENKSMRNEKMINIVMKCASANNKIINV